jgi:2-dehydropantoate 2-reductase
MPSSHRPQRPSLVPGVDSGESPVRVLVVGAGAIGGVVAASLSDRRERVAVLTTNADIRAALAERGFRLSGKTRITRAPVGEVFGELPSGVTPFDYVLLATQPPQVEEAARDAARVLAPDGLMVCFQNGLCETRVAAFVGRDRVAGAVVAWGASMTEPGVYERTSEGGFSIGRLEGPPDARLERLGVMLDCIGPVTITESLLGARWSKLAINCAISSLGTIGGDRVGALMRHGFVRRLALEIMSEATSVARAESVPLQKLAGTVDLEWLALTEAEQRRPGSTPTIIAKHAVLLAAGFRYRRLRSSMLAAIERGRPPAVDFLNGEIVAHGDRAGVSVPVNRAAQAKVWQIARGERRSSLETLRAFYEETR